MVHPTKIGVAGLISFALYTVLLFPHPVEFFPLSVGNTWKHEVKFSGGEYHYFMTGRVTQTSLSLLDSYSYVVVEDYEPLTEKAPKAKSTVAYFRKGGFLNRYPWLDSEGDDVWDTALGEGADRILPTPFNGEEEWSVSTRTQAWPIEGGQTVSGSATATIDQDPVRVPAGTFEKCLRVETVTASSYIRPDGQTDDFQLVFTEWYAPGVGLVRAISSEGAGTAVKSVTTLVSYEIK